MIHELFSKRMRIEQGEVKDIYVYDDIPKKLRVQITHLLDEAIGYELEPWEYIKKIMYKQLGVMHLGYRSNDERTECISFLLEHKKFEEVMDIIELSFYVVDKKIRVSDYRGQLYGRCLSADEAIEELNYWFKENGVGYEYIDGKIIRIDSQYIHKEIIKPAMNLLYAQEFKGANDEFLKAHEYYRKGQYKESILNAGKSFESTMKTICEELEFEYDKDRDTANKLIKILCENDLIPISLKTHFEGLEKAIGGIRTSLDNGLPVVRNRKGGHGQGNDVTEVPSELVTYALNLAATNIVLLVNLYQNYEV